ncbi:MAG: NADH-quinone oxidoreductase subunit L, partial [Nitrospiraceae bacterium]
MTLPLSDIFAVLPELIVVTAACVVLALDPLTAPARKSWLAWLSLASLVACFGISASQMGVTVPAFG